MCRKKSAKKKYETILTAANPALFLTKCTAFKTYQVPLVLHTNTLDCKDFGEICEAL